MFHGQTSAVTNKNDAKVAEKKSAVIQIKNVSFYVFNN